jgi:hypothetical protein
MYAVWDPSNQAKYLHVKVKKHETISKLKTSDKYTESRRITYMPLVASRVYQIM